MIAGIDLGKTWIRAQGFDASSRNQEARLSATNTVVRMGTPATSVDEIVAGCVAAVREVALKSASSLTSVGVGTFGIVDEVRGMVVKSGSLPFWNDIPLSTLLRDELDVPVWIVNDVAADAIGVVACREMNEAGAFALVKLGTSVGVSGGGEHLSGLTLKKDFGQVARLLSRSGRSLSESLGGQAMDQRAQSLMGPQATSRDLFETARTEAPEARGIAMTWLDDLVDLLSYVSSLLAPDTIYLSGAMASGAEAMEDELRRRFHDSIFHLLDTPKLSFVRNEGLARLGAAHWAAVNGGVN
jgi:glucokinase